MAVKKLQLESTKSKSRVRKLKIQPVKRVFHTSSEVIALKELHKPANDEVIEIDLGLPSLKMCIRPITSLIAQVSYEPGGHTFEEEIYAFLWVCESKEGWRFWTPEFSNQVVEAWKNITKGL